MLTYLLGRLSIAQSHWVAKRMGIYEGMHDFLHGFCPCAVDLDPGEHDLDTPIPFLPTHTPAGERLLGPKDFPLAA